MLSLPYEHKYLEQRKTNLTDYFEKKLREMLNRNRKSLDSYNEKKYHIKDPFLEIVIKP